MFYINGKRMYGNKRAYGIVDTSDNTIEWYTADVIQKLLKSGVSILGTKLSADGKRLSCRQVTEDELGLVRIKTRAAALGMSESELGLREKDGVYTLNASLFWIAKGVIDGELRIPQGVNVLDGRNSLAYNVWHKLESLPQFNVLSIPNSCSVILQNSFQNYACWYLNKLNYVISGLEYLREVGAGAFSFTSNLVGDIKFGHNLRIVGDKAFMNTGISRVFIPNSCAKIGTLAFSGNRNLVEVVIEPGTDLTVLGDHVFYDCPNVVIRCERAFFEKNKSQLPGLTEYRFFDNK